MKTRLEMIGEIRTMLPRLWDASQFALAKEIMGDIDYYNFTGVTGAVVQRIWTELCDATGRIGTIPKETR